MNVQTVNMSVSQYDARVLLREYKEHRSMYDKRDWEIEKIYRAIAKGKTIISAGDVIRAAGLNSKGLPLLAIGRADAQQIRCQVYNREVEFRDRNRNRGGGKLTFPMPTAVNWSNGIALVPRIPPQHRPATVHLEKYWILWEADWTTIPRDPYLLRRIGKDAWIVLAAWELTNVEMMVLRAHQPRQ